MARGRASFALQSRDVVAGACALLLAYFAFLQAFDTTLGARNPALGERIHPLAQGDVRAWTIAAVLDPKKLADPAIVVAARLALRRNPYDAEPLRALAYQRNAIGRTREAERLVELSVSVSRRDELAQLLLTQLHAKAGRERRALQHLGRAIRTTNRGREAIYDIMVPLLGDQAVRTELAALATPQNAWMPELLLHALRKGGSNSGYVAQVLLRMPSAEAGRIVEPIGAELLSQLAQAGESTLARRIFALHFPGEESLLRTAAIDASTTRAGLGWLGWTPIETGATGSQLGTAPNGDWGVLAYSTPGKTGVTVLRRALFLPPGRYRLTDRRNQVAGDRSGQFRWNVQCFISGLWTSIAVLGGGMDGASMAIGPDCPMQLVELQAFTSRSGEGIEVTIEQLSIRG